MANKRTFKKFVNGMASNVCEDMMIYRLSVKGIDSEAVESAVEKVIAAAARACVKANIRFDKAPRDFESKHEYNVSKNKFFAAEFSKISTEFIDEINVALKQFNAAVPQEQRQQNK